MRSVTIEAAPMAAEAKMVEAVVTALITIVHKAIALIEWVASIARPSNGGTSLSAVSPDNDFKEGTLALAGV